MYFIIRDDSGRYLVRHHLRGCRCGMCREGEGAVFRSFSRHAVIREFRKLSGNRELRRAGRSGR